ncbi:MAG: GNAT family N-acetyltransferase [Phycisphaerales bacterium JB038]
MTSTDVTSQSLPTGPLPPGYRLLRAPGKLHRAALAEIIAPGRTDGTELVRGFLEYAGGRGLDVTRVWAVLDRAQTVFASALAVPSPGRVAMVFASPPHGKTGRQCLAAAIDALSADLPEVDLAQAILAPDDEDLAVAFEAGGYKRLATLSYQELRLPARAPAAVDRWPADVVVKRYADLAPSEASALFRRALEASYIDTRDCPQLCGLRDSQDVLAGHLATGEFDPGLWTLLLHRDEPAGVLLLTLLAERAAHELVYLGLAPSLRGQGVSRLLLQEGIRQLCERRARVLSLAVDESNEPARRLYAELGFVERDRRLALIRDVRAVC